MAKQKFYAIKKGHRVGIVNTWAECQALTKGYSGAIYKVSPQKKRLKTLFKGLIVHNQHTLWLIIQVN